MKREYDYNKVLSILVVAILLGCFWTYIIYKLGVF